MWVMNNRDMVWRRQGQCCQWALGSLKNQSRQNQAHVGLWSETQSSKWFTLRHVSLLATTNLVRFVSAVNRSWKVRFSFKKEEESNKSRIIEHFSRFVSHVHLYDMLVTCDIHISPRHLHFRTGDMSFNNFEGSNSKT